MTQASTTTPLISATDDENGTPTDLPHEHSETPRLGPQSTLDSDTSERPVREKLKKTSIATISQHDIKAHEGVTMSEEKDTTDNARTELDLAPADRLEDPESDPIRGRPVKKRLFDHSEMAQADEDSAMANASETDRPNGHVRKRSRDVSLIEPIKSDRQLRVVDATVEEEVEEAASHAGSSGSMNAESEIAKPSTALHLETPMELERGSDTTIHQLEAEESLQEAGCHYADKEMQDPTSSPRRKRSRDQMETEAHREQKIPATEEARAQRRSDELERKESMEVSNGTAAVPDASTPSRHHPAQKAENSTSKVSETKSATEAPLVSLEETPTLASAVSVENSASPLKHSNHAPPKTSGATFEYSGFAAFSRSSASPFGTLGASSGSTNASMPIAPSSAENINNDDSPEGDGAKKAEPAVGGGFGSFAKSSSAGFHASEPSPFLTSAAGKNSVFGGSAFGSGFGGGFGSGGKLTNFAAPVGDTKLGNPNGVVKPIGSPAHEEDEDKENSDDGGEREGENGDGSGDEVDEMFQRQDVETGEDDETTVFSSRASLFIFKDRSWKEGGKGIFKFNVTTSVDADSPPNSGRFIMRAGQTFRVLLNAPVLKKMTVGDGRGKEPNGKSFSFGVVESGLLVPYLLKLSDTAESRTLYQEVRRLQDSMPEG